MSLKTRTIVLISLSLVIGFLTTSLVSYFVSSASLRSAIVQRELPLTGDNIYSEIERDLLRPIFISSLMAIDTFLRDWVIAGEQDIRQIQRYLREVQEKCQTFTSFFVSEKTRLYYHPSGILKKVDPDDPRDAWYFRVREMTQDYEINVDPDMANNDTITIFINYRVFDYSGNFIGAIGVGLKAAAVKELIESYQQRYRRNIYFVNRDARIVLYGSGIDITQPDLYRRTGISDIAGDIIQEKHDALEYVKNGGTVLLSVRFVPELDWFLLVEQDESEALSALRRTLLINLLICALVTLTVLALVRYIVNYFQHRIEVLALSDKLTGLPNRQAFDLNFQQTMRQIRRHPVPVSIILFDIDRFKSVNDRFGHLFGDRVLRAVARTVADQIREVDLLCRWGGEEFLLLLPGCILRDAQDIAENIRGSIEHLRIEDDHHVTDVTVSLGVTEYRLGENEDDLLRRADDALYRAKEGGRNRCVVES